VRARPPWLAALALVGSAATAPLAAEPIFLSRQYAHCTNCHYSPTGGGLLTPYGRSLSREELSTWGKSPGATPSGREHEFLFGALGDALGPVSVGVELRPAHLSFSYPGTSDSRDFFMNADVTAAFRAGRWTFYGEFGRQPRTDGTLYRSFEHWVSYEGGDGGQGFGVRVGRFLPAYGVRFADHTTFTRTPLGLDNQDQVYAVEGSYKDARNLVQVSIGPGRAEDVTDSDKRAITASGRYQFDITPRTVIVASGLVRDSSDVEPSGGSTGLAFGFAPARRLTLWTEGDVLYRSGEFKDHLYTGLVHASYEVYRGLWLEVFPQIATAYGDSSAGTLRLGAGINWLPRTHWNLILNYYDDKDRQSDAHTKTFLLQLHLYL
jgi:hypothetical protein